MSEDKIMNNKLRDTFICDENKSDNSFCALSM